MLKKQLNNLDDAAMEVIRRYGRLDMPWGEIIYFQNGNTKVPLSGGGGILSVMKCAYGTMNRSHQIPVHTGSSYMMVIEMSDKPKAFSCFPIGIDENSKSKHFLDMTLYYSKNQFKPVYYTWEELESNIESIEIFSTRTE
jgi:acyl-homoserine lactone acylase PvdQ